MLYVSRFVAGHPVKHQQYGVYDTDDGVETIATYKEITDAALEYGIEIAGVDVSYFSGVRSLDNIAVYQEPLSVTVKQTKLKTLTGVDTKYFRGSLSALDISQAAQGTRLRLSDYCSKCEDYIIVIGPTTPHQPVMTIVLDDKVRFQEKTFRGFAEFGAIMDLRELSNDTLASYIYLEAPILSSRQWHIIDNQFRYDTYVGISIIKGQIHGMVVTDFDRHEEISALVWRHFSKEFNRLANGFYEIGINDLDMLEEIREKLSGVDIAAIPAEAVKDSAIPEFLDFVRAHSVSSHSTYISYLRNFVHYCDIVPEAVGLIKQFCKRALDLHLR